MDLNTNTGNNKLMKLSKQQLAAVDAIKNGRQSIILSAVAGAGKTSTLIEMLNATDGSVAFCAFNKPIADEIQNRIEQKNINKNVRVGTVHSFGFGAVRRAFPNVALDDHKLRNIANEKFRGKHLSLKEFVISSVRLAKETGIGAVVEDTHKNWFDLFDRYNLWDLIPKEFTDDNAVVASQFLLKKSNETKDVIDFSDMIYIPILHNLKVWQYDYVFLDEAQDTNATRRKLIRMMLKPNGQLVAVGDVHQAIYGFTGADHNSLNLIQEEFCAKELPLSVTFRCPKNVVKVAKKYVDHIESHSNSPDGIVDECTIQELPNLVTQYDAIICRNTKPLIEVAYDLIRKKIPCKVEGRSIGEGLVKLATKWKCRNVQQLTHKLNEYKENEIKKHKEKDNLQLCQMIEDQVESLYVFIDQCYLSDSITTLTDKIKEIFDDTQDKQILVLSTIHKSKGREFPRVFVLGMDAYSPSKWAKKDWELQQETNLVYVQVTRAMNHLTMVNVNQEEK